MEFSDDRSTVLFYPKNNIPYTEQEVRIKPTYRDGKMFKKLVDVVKLDEPYSFEKCAHYTEHDLYRLTENNPVIFGIMDENNEYIEKITSDSFTPQELVHMFIHIEEIKKLLADVDNMTVEWRVKNTKKVTKGDMNFSPHNSLDHNKYYTGRSFEHFADPLQTEHNFSDSDELPEDIYMQKYNQIEITETGENYVPKNISFRLPEVPPRVEPGPEIDEIIDCDLRYPFDQAVYMLSTGYEKSPMSLLSEKGKCRSNFVPHNAIFPHTMYKPYNPNRAYERRDHEFKLPSKENAIKMYRYLKSVKEYESSLYKQFTDVIDKYLFFTKNTFLNQMPEVPTLEYDPPFIVKMKKTVYDNIVKIHKDTLEPLRKLDSPVQNTKVHRGTVCYRSQIPPKPVFEPIHVTGVTDEILKSYEGLSL